MWINLPICLGPYQISAVMILFRIGQHFDHGQQPSVGVIFYAFQFRNPAALSISERSIAAIEFRFEFFEWRL